MSRKMSSMRLVILTALLLGLTASRPGTRLTAASESGADAIASTSVQAQHVVIVMLENHSYSSMIGSSSMPFLNRLARHYAYAKSYYANTHPSIGNYFEMTTGQIITNNDSYTQTVTADNIVRHLVSAKKSWKEYTEGLPYVGYIGGNNGEYTQHHNPLSYFSDVRNSSTQRKNLVPFTQFSTDISNHALPRYSFVVPDDDHNGHDCPDTIPSCSDSERLSAVDSWLQANIQPLTLSSDFNAFQGGLLIIVVDESNTTDTAHGGGHVAWVVAGPGVKNGYVSSNLYQHQSTLRFASEAAGLTTFPGSAATAPDMKEFIVGN